MNNFKKYDFVFLPHYFISNHTLEEVDLGINMISFQEMTTTQVRNYVNWLSKCKCETIYSHNRSRSPHNDR